MINKESALAVADSVGLTIDTIEVDESCVKINFDDASKLTILDDGQSCCESRWLTCDDDVTAFQGARFVGAHTSDVGEWEGDESEFECHEVEFLIVETTLGSFTVATHVDSNGYYGGFMIRAKRELGTKLSPGVNHGVHPSGTLPSAPETSVEKGTKDA